MKKFKLAACLLALAAPFISTSCSTTKGFGQDLQKVGSRLENQADATGGTAPAAPTAPAPAPGVPYAY